MVHRSPMGWDADVLARIQALELHARALVDGYVHGAHASHQVASNVEFSDFKEYAPGDPLRDLDWRVLGRSDRLVVRRHRAEHELTTTLVVDASGDLATGASGGWPTAEGSPFHGSKWGYAAVLTATLAYWLLRQGEPVGLQVLGGDRVEWRTLPPRTGDSQLARILGVLAALDPAGERGWRGLSGWAAASPAAARRARERPHGRALGLGTGAAGAAGATGLRVVHLHDRDELAMNLPEQASSSRPGWGGSPEDPRDPGGLRRGGGSVPRRGRGVAGGARGALPGSHRCPHGDGAGTAAARPAVSVSLLAPLALGLGLLVAGPLLAHIARRRRCAGRPRAMMLLKRLEKRLRRRRRIQDPWLLLLRILAVLLAVLAATRPELRWPGTPPPDEPRAPWWWWWTPRCPWTRDKATRACWHGREQAVEHCGRCRPAPRRAGDGGRPAGRHAGLLADRASWRRVGSSRPRRARTSPAPSARRGASSTEMARYWSSPTRQARSPCLRQRRAVAHERAERGPRAARGSALHRRERRGLPGDLRRGGRRRKRAPRRRRDRARGSGGGHPAGRGGDHGLRGGWSRGVRGKDHHGATGRRWRRGLARVDDPALPADNTHAFQLPRVGAAGCWWWTATPGRRRRPRRSTSWSGPWLPGAPRAPCGAGAPRYQHRRCGGPGSGGPPGGVSCQRLRPQRRPLGSPTSSGVAEASWSPLGTTSPRSCTTGRWVRCCRVRSSGCRPSRRQEKTACEPSCPTPSRRSLRRSPGVDAGPSEVHAGASCMPSSPSRTARG